MLSYANYKMIKLPVSLTTITLYSKLLTGILFILFVASGFFAGMKYQAMTDFIKIQQSNLITTKPSPTPTDNATSWQTYGNEEYGFEIEYPKDWKIIQRSQKEEELSTFTFSKSFDGCECRLEILIDKANYFKKENMSSDLKSQGYYQNKVLIDNIEAIRFTHPDFPTQPKYFLEKELKGEKLYFRIFFEAIDSNLSGHDLVFTEKHQCGNIFNQILSSFKFIEFPEEIKNNENFIKWLRDWQTSNPSLAIYDFSKERTDGFTISSTLGEQKVRSYCLSEHYSEAREIYSPDKTKSVYFPCNLGEPDLDVWLYNKNRDGKMELISSTGPSVGYDGAFWIDNDRFVILSYFWDTDVKMSIYITYWDLISKKKITYKASGVNPK
jgi:hypothetical protein